MPKPIARKVGICFAFPDILQTPVPGSSPVPIPYPNIAQLADTQDASGDVNAGGEAVVLKSSNIPSSSGGEAGSASPNGQECTFTSASETVFANGQGIVRMGDGTSQNAGNAQGNVMVGFPTVLVGD